jgi:hypothetical protein
MQARLADRPVWPFEMAPPTLPPKKYLQLRRQKVRPTIQVATKGLVGNAIEWPTLLTK